VHNGVQARGGERDAGVVQDRTAADHEVAAVRVRRGQPPAQVGLQQEAAAVVAPPPGLAVVHRRRVAAELDSGADGLAVDRVDDHGRYSRLVTGCSGHDRNLRAGCAGIVGP